MQEKNRELAALGARIELAARSFFYYCKLSAPDFYNQKRKYIVNVCEELQAFIDDDTDVCIINMPPRTGKSRTAQKLVEWVLGKDKTFKIMTGSYNETLSTQFAKGVRNTIQETKADVNLPVYSDVFPNVRIKQGDGAMNLWSLEGGYNNYLATSPTGTATGFGADMIIIDDLIKNSTEAHNENVKDAQWNWFTDTMLSRLEGRRKILIIMTRWATDDLVGRVLTHFDKIGLKVKHINYKAKNDDGTMLCDEILSAEEYSVLEKTLGADIFNANYQQEPIDLKGCLYSEFKVYEQVPMDRNGHVLFSEIKNYTDTADEGSDYLCSIVYGIYNKDAYVLDVIYTQDRMEETEPATARMLVENEVTFADIESNNGGRGFARNVERILKEEYGYLKCKVNWFHQSGNKKARILSNATVVMNNIYFPVNWKEKWTAFHNEVSRYQREGKNAHDDGCDVLTGIAEALQGRRKMKINPNVLLRRR